MKTHERTWQQNEVKVIYACNTLSLLLFLILCSRTHFVTKFIVLSVSSSFVNAISFPLPCKRLFLLILCTKALLCARIKKPVIYERKVLVLH